MLCSTGVNLVVKHLVFRNTAYLLPFREDHMKQEETAGDNLNSLPTRQLSCTTFRFLWRNEGWTILPMWRQDSTLKRRCGSYKWTPLAAGWLRTMLPYFALLWLHSIVGITVSHLFLMSHNYLFFCLNVSVYHQMVTPFPFSGMRNVSWRRGGNWRAVEVSTSSHTPILLCDSVAIAIEFCINILVGSSLPET